jgi:SAM-dependent methyltransferase
MPTMTDPTAVYEEWFVPAVFAPLAREVLAQTAIPATARILDVACGSGIVARTAATQIGDTGRVVGIDANPAMLAAARRAAAAEGLTIEWRKGNAEDLPFADASFDLVLCQQGMQFFPDRQRAADEMHRVLAPGGEVALTTWRGLDQHPICAALARSARERFGSPALEAPFNLGDPAELGRLLQGAGFTDISVEPVAIETDYTEPGQFTALQLTASTAGIPALQGMSPAEREVLIAAVGDDLATLIHEATIGDRLRFPMHAIVARGVRY